MSGTVRQRSGPRPRRHLPMPATEILRLRRLLGLTHDELGTRIGVAAKTLREWERDLKVASVRASERLRAIATPPAGTSASREERVATP